MSPLWKGQRFPITQCISGWAMLNDDVAIIPDITVDERVPHEAYRPTFVKSLVMVPVGSPKPLAAIGAYWARAHRPTEERIQMLCDLARETAIAIDRVGLADAPFTPTLKNGNLYSRGAADDKGQLFCHIKALESWLHTGRSLPVNVKCIFEGEEEIGSPHLMAFIARKRTVLRLARRRVSFRK